MNFFKVLAVFSLVVLLASCGANRRVAKTKTPKAVISTNTDTKPQPQEQEETLESTSTTTVKINTVEEYIAAYKDIAMVEMRKYNIPASITLAQAILESGAGKGELTTKANNHFGIKCHKGWTGPSVSHDDDAKGECFRKYKHPNQSFEDHSLFLTSRSRYAFLFDLPLDDYKAWARGLKKAGYATDPKYPAKLISLIERYDLNKYDDMVLEDRPNFRRRTEDKTNAKYHIVQKGDTLYRIATLNKISVEDLKKLNGLTTNNISPGQKLKVQ